MLLLAACSGSQPMRGASGLDDGASAAALGACRSDADCDDGIDCTQDECSFTTPPEGTMPVGVCAARAGSGACSADSTCDVRSGCEPGVACAVDADCTDDDPCTVDEACDPASRTCRYAVLDGDNDGHVPVVCGGIDCDDSNRQVPAPEDDDCDGVDDDCDGQADESLDLEATPRACCQPPREGVDNRAFVQPSVGDRCDEVLLGGQLLWGDAACVVRLVDGSLDVSMFCHPEEQVCALACHADEDCPSSWQCDLSPETLVSTARQEAPNGTGVCVNPRCP